MFQTPGGLFGGGGVSLLNNAFGAANQMSKPRSMLSQLAGANGGKRPRQLGSSPMMRPNGMPTRPPSLMQGAAAARHQNGQDGSSMSSKPQKTSKKRSLTPYHSQQSIVDEGEVDSNNGDEDDDDKENAASKKSKRGSRLSIRSKRRSSELLKSLTGSTKPSSARLSALTSREKSETTKKRKRRNNDEEHNDDGSGSESETHKRKHRKRRRRSSDSGSEDEDYYDRLFGLKKKKKKNKSSRRNDDDNDDEVDEENWYSLNALDPSASRKHKSGSKSDLASMTAELLLARKPKQNIDPKEFELHQSEAGVPVRRLDPEKMRIPGSAVLIGGSGCGKTTMLENWLAHHCLKFDLVFVMTNSPGARLIYSKHIPRNHIFHGFAEMELKVCDEVCSAAFERTGSCPSVLFIGDDFADEEVKKNKYLKTFIKRNRNSNISMWLILHETGDLKKSHLNSVHLAGTMYTTNALLIKEAFDIWFSSKMSRKQYEMLRNRYVTHAGCALLMDPTTGEVSYYQSIHHDNLASYVAGGTHMYLLQHYYAKLAGSKIGEDGDAWEDTSKMSMSLLGKKEVVAKKTPAFLAGDHSVAAHAEAIMGGVSKHEEDSLFNLFKKPAMFDGRAPFTSSQYSKMALAGVAPTRQITAAALKAQQQQKMPLFGAAAVLRESELAMERKGKNKSSSLSSSGSKKKGKNASDNTASIAHHQQKHRVAPHILQSDGELAALRRGEKPTEEDLKRRIICF